MSDAMGTWFSRQTLHLMQALVAGKIEKYCLTLATPKNEFFISGVDQRKPPQSSRYITRVADAARDFDAIKRIAARNEQGQLDSFIIESGNHSHETSFGKLALKPFRLTYWDRLAINLQIRLPAEGQNIGAFAEQEPAPLLVKFKCN